MVHMYGISRRNNFSWALGLYRAGQAVSDDLSISCARRSTDLNSDVGEDAEIESPYPV